MPMAKLVIVFVVFLVCSSNTCKPIPPKLGDCSKVDCYWVRDKTTTEGRGDNTIIHHQGSLWIKIDKNVVQGINMEMFKSKFISFTGEYPHNYDLNSNTLTVQFPGLTGTNGKTLLLGEVVTTWRPIDEPNIQGPSARLSYLANSLGDFSQCVWEKNWDGNMNKNYRANKERFALNESEL